MATTGASARRGRAKIMAPRKHGPEFSAEKTWSELARNIREIQDQNASNLSFEENHRFAYNMVLNKHGEMLYNGLKRLVAEDLETLATRNIVPHFPSGTTDPSVQSGEDDLLLTSLKAVWTRHINNMVRLGQILKYMDRVYTQTAKVPATNDLGLQLFLKHIIRPPIKENVMAAILNQIRHERNGYVIDRSTMKGCVDVYLSLEGDTHGATIYKLDLEPAVLKESETFYKREGEELLNSSTAPIFLQSSNGSKQKKTEYTITCQAIPNHICCKSYRITCYPHIFELLYLKKIRVWMPC
ncbi:unnamed protein product [Cyclocybe aegerita]|uniref:Cullin N-terminal domain-containing protein n=1 Tax=Cyclocybe aegerita TaxID=1973307 RepID=A0A8S0W8K0_CYCAE|nr:unnamed protein product [Cyclocybe aegerita]